MIDPRRHTLLRVGRLRLAFVDGRLQWLSVGPVEVVRRIYVALRDDHWTTVPFSIDRRYVDLSESAFEVRYDAVASSRCGTFAFTVEIHGGANETVEMALRGEARTVLATNRVGLCLHVPHELSGVALRSWRVDDPVEQAGRFPVAVEPTPPLKDLGGIVHPVNETTWCRTSFFGDVFEMEDQRNFGDASFKVYSTPSDDPIPRVLQPGDRIEQRIVVALEDAPKEGSVEASDRRAAWFLGAAALERAAVDPMPPGASGHSVPSGSASAPRTGASGVRQPVVIEVSQDVVGMVPELGTDVSRWCAEPERGPRSDHAAGAVGAAAKRIERLGIERVRLELDLADRSWPVACRRGIELAAAAQVRIDLVLTGRGSAWPDDVPDWLAVRSDRVATVCLTGPLDDRHRLAERVRRLRRALRASGADVLVGAGSTGWFIDVNGADLPEEGLDFLAYALTPQVHVFDDDALRENLHAIVPALTTAHSLAQGRSVRVGPVTLRPRGRDAGATEALWPSARDPRLDHPLGAIWALGAIAQLAAGGAAAATLFELEGPEAIPDLPLDAETSPTPSIAAILRDVAPLSDRAVLKTVSSSPLDAFAFAVRTAGGRIGWLANPTDRPVEVELRTPEAAAQRTARIDLDPYALRRFAWEDPA